MVPRYDVASAQSWSSSRCWRQSSGIISPDLQIFARIQTPSCPNQVCRYIQIFLRFEYLHEPIPPVDPTSPRHSQIPQSTAVYVYIFARMPWPPPPPPPPLVQSVKRQHVRRRRRRQRWLFGGYFNVWHGDALPSARKHHNANRCRSDKYSCMTSAYRRCWPC